MCSRKVAAAVQSGRATTGSTQNELPLRAAAQAQRMHPPCRAGELLVLHLHAMTRFQHTNAFGLPVGNCLVLTADGLLFFPLLPVQVLVGALVGLIVSWIFVTLWKLIAAATAARL